MLLPITTRPVPASAVRICRGLYVPREPTGEELAAIVHRRWPDAALDGASAAQHYLDQRLSLPLQLLREKGLGQSPYFQARRARPRGAFVWYDRAVCNPLQALEAMEYSAAVEFLEAFLSGKDALARLDDYESQILRLPARSRRIIGEAIIGADSAPERRLTRALSEDFSPKNNVYIGPYRWDIVLPRQKVAIEVDGYEYHRGEKIQRFELDRQKLNDAVQRRWRPLHFTAAMVEHHLDLAVAQVQAVACGGGEYLPAAWKWHYYWRER
ncbi:hypothetical protein ACWIB8_09675 [Corynebacterium flavescens]